MPNLHISTSTEEVSIGSHVMDSANGRDSSNQASKRQKTDTLLMDKFESHDSPGAVSLQVDWADVKDCFIFVVDCKPLADVINGHIKLECEELKDTIEKTVTRLAGILDVKWRPSGILTDPVRWASRKHNIVADYLCNFAMDHQKTFHEVCPIRLSQNFNLIVHSDGGARADCAAAAWVVEATSWRAEAGEWQVQTLAYSATYINSWTSSFTAEAMTLYQAVDFVSEYVGRLHS